jgi:putative Mg2+ transporter-C (MgtC) family protein
MAFTLSPLEMEIVVKLVLSAFFGGLIGLEREFNKSSAGIKTYSIVCMGSALFTVASLYTDIRIAAGVITGIGFLGAATIFRNEKSKSPEGRVSGITTAALIWSIAATGFVVGVGMYFAAAVATAIMLIILIPVEHVEKKYIHTLRE